MHNERRDFRKAKSTREIIGDDKGYETTGFKKHAGL